MEMAIAEKIVRFVEANFYPKSGARKLEIAVNLLTLRGFDKRHAILLANDAVFDINCGIRRPWGVN